jgi:hypothetical protein
MQHNSAKQSETNKQSVLDKVYRFLLHFSPQHHSGHLRSIAYELKL